MAFCPIARMIGDFVTKTLQGATFVSMHEKILNLTTSLSANIYSSVLENRKNMIRDSRSKDMNKPVKTKYKPPKTNLRQWKKEVANITLIMRKTRLRKMTTKQMLKEIKKLSCGDPASTVHRSVQLVVLSHELQHPSLLLL